MMCKIFWLGCLLFIGQVSLAQEEEDSVTDNIITSKKYRSGIHQTFKEFRNNNPSITEGFKVRTDTANLGVFSLSYSERSSPAFSFSDGKDVYINTESDLMNTSHFVKLTVIGVICYFEEGKEKPKARPKLRFKRTFKNKDIRSDAKNPGHIIYLPEHTGRSKKLSRRNLVLILKREDPELYKTLLTEKDSQTPATLLSYILKFNDRQGIK